MNSHIWRVYSLFLYSFFFFLHNIQLFQHHLLKGLSFLNCLVLAPLSKINWLYLWESTSGISTLFHWSVYLFFLAVSQCLDYCSFIVTLEVGYCQSFNFIFLFWHSTGYSESFTLPYQLQNQSVDIYKITCWNFDWDWIESIDQVEKNWHFHNNQTLIIRF